MRWTLGPVLALVLLGAGADVARAQECPAPVIRGFALTPEGSDPSTGVLGPDSSTPDHFRAGTAGGLRVTTEDAAAVEIDWGDGQRQRVAVRRGAATATHVYRRRAHPQIVATAFAACGAASAPGGFTVPVHPPCERTRGGDVFLSDCDEERSQAFLYTRGLFTEAAWLSAPCRDVIEIRGPVPPEPVARAAACAAPTTEPPYSYLPVARERRLRLVLSAAATRVTFALGSPDARLGRRRTAELVGRSGRHWRIRLPRALGSRDRIEIRAHRAGRRDYYLAGITRD